MPRGTAALMIAEAATADNECPPAASATIGCFRFRFRFRFWPLAGCCQYAFPGDGLFTVPQRVVLGAP